MADAKLCSPIPSTSEALVVCLAIGHCSGEELGSFYQPVLAAGVAIVSASYQFAEHASHM